MTRYSVKVKPVTLLNSDDNTYNLRCSPSPRNVAIGLLCAVALIVFLMAIGLVGAVFLPLFPLSYLACKYVFSRRQILHSRNCDAANACFVASLMHAIRCKYPKGVVYILHGIIAELQNTNACTNVRVMPNYCRLESALILATEADARSTEILGLAGEVGMDQTMDKIRGILHSVQLEGYYLKVTARDHWFWFNWTEDDQREYIANQRPQIARDMQAQTTNETHIPIPSTTAHFQVLGLDEFTSTHLTSFEKYQQINPSLQYLSEDEQLRTYMAYQKVEYQRYLDRVGSSKSSPVEIQNDHLTTPQRNSDLDIW